MTKHTRKRALFALLLSLALFAAACGDTRDDDGDTGDTGATETDSPTDGGTETATDGETAAECPEPSTGITADTIKLGGTYPLSGPASAYGAIGQAVQAYFEYANGELGGAPGAFEGREFEYVIKDDGYNPPNTVEAVRELVEQEQVFALFQNLGTPPVAAVWDYVNQQEVPQPFVATGASLWGLNQEHPWTIGWQPNYVSESRVYAQYLKENHAGSTIAVLYQNDDYGQDYLNGFKSAIEGSDLEIVAEQSYETTDATLDSQMTNLAQSEADVFFNITTPSFAAKAMGFDAQSDWNPVHLLNSVSNSLTVVGAVGFEPLQGIVTALYLKDPADEQFQEDEDVQNYMEMLAEYGPDLDPNNGFAVYGWAVADSFYKLLEQTECPTREALQEAWGNLNDVEFAMALPGITMNTGSDDRFPLESMQIATLQGETWELQGDVINTREVFGPVSEAVGDG
ncbi:MAG: ABC transporter substrate-binding protein [Nitriliruptorales bacterium]|nr:ABC transporter substrate-binding protein [Nitriliruptorales bacterium]